MRDEKVTEFVTPFSDEDGMATIGITNTQALKYFEKLKEEFEGGSISLVEKILNQFIVKEIKLKDFKLYIPQYGKEMEIDRIILKFKFGGESVVEVLEGFINYFFIGITWNLMNEFPFEKLDIILNKKMDLNVVWYIKNPFPQFKLADDYSKSTYYDWNKGYADIQESGFKFELVGSYDVR